MDGSVGYQTTLYGSGILRYRCLDAEFGVYLTAVPIRNLVIHAIDVNINQNAQEMAVYFSLTICNVIIQYWSLLN